MDLKTAEDKPSRPQWIGWAITAVTVPALLAGLGVAVAGERIEGQLTAGARNALAGAGHPDAQVRTAGRDISLSGVPAERMAALTALVATVPGVDSVTATDLAPTPVVLRVRDGEIAIAGSGHSGLHTQRLLRAVTERCPGHRVADLTLLSPGTGPVLPADRIARIAGAAAEARGADLTVAVRSDGITVHGVVADADQRAILVERLREQGKVEEDGLRTGPPAIPSTVDIGALHGSVERMIRGSGGINFVAATTRWEGHGPVLVDRVARLLHVAPKSLVTVTALASAEQPPGVDAQALADRRAAAVRDVLVAQGVPQALIVPVGRVEPGLETYNPHLRRALVAVS
ncbi:peptidoglycan-binding protein ArfA [Crossiella equi]|uniref:Peptidoglycan-binding protein ArfA n=1 Tax=Crossiella equi TaxID=130796 RepID=A0ABS5A5Z5_9PSEU|nr:OmpA family protein [Crossiella equi]MBP2472024.1 peptidoglycan-binding protein ArfA [Crossiella equi]